MDFWQPIIQSIIPTTVSLLLGFVIGRMNKKADKKDALEEANLEEQKQRADESDRNIKLVSDGICELLRVKLIEYHDQYMEKGSIPSYVFDNFTSMYNTYHDLGGNGMITHMYEELKELPINRK